MIAARQPRIAYCVSRIAYNARRKAQDARRLMLVALTLIAFTGSAEVAAQGSGTIGAREILRRAGIQGGLIVHLGCGDGKLTAALRATDSYVVHGLDRDPKDVARARKHIRSLGLYGPVSVEQCNGKSLPYADNLINLVVSERRPSIPMAEIMRVLCPNGIAYIEQDGKWTKKIKPVPDDIGEWNHYLNGPENNAVAADRRVGPPRRLQWSGRWWRGMRLTGRCSGRSRSPAEGRRSPLSLSKTSCTWLREEVSP